MPIAHLEWLNPHQLRAVEHRRRRGGCSVRQAPPRDCRCRLGQDEHAGTSGCASDRQRGGSTTTSSDDLFASSRGRDDSTGGADRHSVVSQGAPGVTEALNWAGTFHTIGARLLRVYANQIAFDPAFMIHDREDSADLLNLLRHRLGFSKTEAHFPPKVLAMIMTKRLDTGGHWPLNNGGRGKYAAQGRRAATDKSSGRAGPQLATYVRYNVLLERDWLKSELGLELAPDKIEQIRKMYDPSNLSNLAELGCLAGGEASQAGASACCLRPAQGAGITTERGTSPCRT
jgi:hypothetical protein